MKGEEITTFANTVRSAIAWLLLLTSALGVGLVSRDLLDPWTPVIPSALIFLLLFVYSPYRVWVEQRDKVERFERDAVPKVVVTHYEHTEPKGAQGIAFRTWRVRIKNISTTPVRNCTVTKKSLINKLSHQSSILGISFKLTTDQPRRLQQFPYQQSFDLRPGTERDVDIAAKDEWDTVDPRVFMLYAIPGGSDAQIANSIADRAFPHTLIIEISADNIMKPEQRTYELSIDAGRLRMKELS